MQRPSTSAARGIGLARILPDDGPYGDSPDPGRLVARDNLYIKSGEPEVSGTVAEPRQSYTYTLDKPAEIAALVKAGAGVGKIGP